MIKLNQRKKENFVKYIVPKTRATRLTTKVIIVFYSFLP